MNFWQIFFRVLPWQPIPAMAALWWHLTGRRLRARNRLRTAGARLPFAYDFWIRRIENSDQPKRRLPGVVQDSTEKTRFAVVLTAEHHTTTADLARSIRSIQQQLHPNWALLIVNSGTLEVPATDDDKTTVVEASWEAAVQNAPGDFIVPLRAGDELSAWALFRFAEAVQGCPDATILYGDHDEIGARGQRTRPWFKPRWNEEFFLARDYISRSCAIEAQCAHDSVQDSGLSGNLPAFGLVLRLLQSHIGPIVHVPHIVAHLHSADGQPDQGARMEAVASYVGARGATAAAGLFDTIKISWPLPAVPPLVSIIVPTKDKVDLLRDCVEGVLGVTDYPALEVLIVDNGSVEPTTLAYFDGIKAHPQVRLLSYPGPYNYSAINNFAARAAEGSYLCLLNNDTEVLDKGWLTEMMRYAVRSDVGAVGAKLLYADGTIQHAGVIVGVGDGAGHAHRKQPSKDPGYFCHAHVAQFVSAVTGACLVVDKRKFLAVGGLDEEAFAIAYNDVDFCLKLERAGWKNVYVPHAVLIHHESKSRVRDHAPSQIERYRRELKLFQDRWGAKDYDDPLLNPNLDRSSETFVIRL
jgi:GT2 family glycosyltransferase